MAVNARGMKGLNGFCVHMKEGEKVGNCLNLNRIHFFLQRNIKRKKEGETFLKFSFEINYLFFR